MEDFLELRFELSSLENASMWRKNWGLSEACGGGQGNPPPRPHPCYTFALYLSCREETSTSLTAHVIRLLSFHLMQEIGVHTLSAEEKVGIR